MNQNKPICIHQHTHGYAQPGLHPAVLAQRPETSALIAGTKEGRKRRRKTERNKEKQPKQKERSAADGGTTENSRLLRNKCEKKRVPRLWSTPRWERRSRILLLIATGSTCLSVCPSFCLPGALSVCLPGISTSLCVWCLIFYKPLCAGHFPFFLTS